VQNQGAAQWECIVDLTQALGLSKEIVFFLMLIVAGIDGFLPSPFGPKD